MLNNVVEKEIQELYTVEEIERGKRSDLRKWLKVAKRMMVVALLIMFGSAFAKIGLGVKTQVDFYMYESIMNVGAIIFMLGLGLFVTKMIHFRTFRIFKRAAKRNTFEVTHENTDELLEKARPGIIPGWWKGIVWITSLVGLAASSYLMMDFYHFVQREATLNGEISSGTIVLSFAPSLAFLSTLTLIAYASKFRECYIVKSWILYLLASTATMLYKAGIVAIAIIGH